MQPIALRASPGLELPVARRDEERDTIERVLAEVTKAQGLREQPSVTRFDLDASGEPAVWIQVVVPDVDIDDGAQQRVFLDLTARVRSSIHQAFLDAGIERWPYVWFDTESEEASSAPATSR